MTLANKFTILRFVLTMVFFGLLGYGNVVALRLALAVFVLSGITDVADGWAARRFSQQSEFGRVADPLTDKILICGALAFFAAGYPAHGAANWSISPWAAVLVTGRELVVSGLRGYAKDKGYPFGSTVFGKTKMAFQFAAISIAILFLAEFRQNTYVRWLADTAIWVAVAATLATGFVYLYRAQCIMRRAE